MKTIIQISDPHLLLDPDGDIYGVQTRPQFAKILDLVRREWPRPDRLILTGDIAQDENPKTYTIVADLLAEWGDAVRVIPGNHDNREGLRSVFGSQNGCDDQHVCFEDHVGPWQLIGLDTHQPGEVAGRLDGTQLAWCADRLRDHAPGPSLLMMHHPPIAIGSVWLDGMGLHDPEGFHALVAEAPNLKAIACGHIHQVFEGELHGVRVLSAPSTAVQFEPNNPQPAFDTRPAGVRVFEFDNETMQTRVVRLASDA